MYVLFLAELTSLTAPFQCEKDTNQSPTDAEVKERFAAIIKAGHSTTYYHPPLQTSSFILPLWAQKHIYSEDVVEELKDEL